MRTDPVQTSETLNVNNVFIPPFQQTVKSPNIYLSVKYKNDKRPDTKLLFETPRIFAPFGANCYKQADAPIKQYPDYNVCLSLDPSDPRICKIESFLRGLDKYVCEYVSKHPKLLQAIGIRPSDIQKNPHNIANLIESRYVPIVKEGRQKEDGTYFPSMFKCKTFRDHKSHKIETFCEVDKTYPQFTDYNIEEIFHQSMTCRCVILVSHVWIVSRRFGVSLKLMRCKLYPSSKNEYQFNERSDGEEVEEEQKSENSEKRSIQSNDEPFNVDDEYAENVDLYTQMMGDM